MHRTTQVTKRLAFSLVAFSFLAVFAVAATQPVSARRGADDATLSPTQNSETDQENETETETRRQEAVQSRLAEMKENAKKELEQKKEGRKELAEEKRKQVCENRQKAIENKLAAFNQAADKHLAKLDGVFTKVKNYQSEKNLNPVGWADLVAAAEAKQAAATAAVAALKEVAVGVDCSNPETVVKLSEVREAAKATRTALHDYRKALKDMVVALAQAKEDTNDDGGTTSDSASGTSEAGDPNGGQGANE